MSAAPLLVKVEMIQDPICTMCWLGYKRLQRAITLAAEEGFDVDLHIRFLPFQLRPELTIEKSVDRWKLAIWKQGGDEELTKERLAICEGWGREYGIDFRWGGRLRQTTDAHRLLARALELKGETAQVDLAERLYKAALEEETDIGDRDYLTSLMAELMIMTVDGAKSFLASEEGVSEYLLGLRKAIMRGVEGVPVFVFNDRITIDGAQDPSVFLEVLRKLARRST